LGIRWAKPEADHVPEFGAEVKSRLSFLSTLCCESSAARRDWAKYFGRDGITESMIEKCVGIQIRIKGRKKLHIC
jgi:hypothetical protein